MLCVIFCERYIIRARESEEGQKRVGKVDR